MIIRILFLLYLYIRSNDRDRYTKYGGASKDEIDQFTDLRSFSSRPIDDENDHFDQKIKPIFIDPDHSSFVFFIFYFFYFIFLLNYFLSH